MIKRLPYHECEPPPWFARWGARDVFVPDEFRKSVVFLGTVHGERFKPRATAFMVSYEEHDLRFFYLVTAEHVIAGHITRNFELYCRINLTNGDVAQMRVPNDRWRFYPPELGTSDVAVCPITDHGVDDKGQDIVFGFDIKTICVKGKNSIAGLRETLIDNHISVGDEVAITGLFRRRYAS